MPRYDRLRPLAFRLSPEVSSLTSDFYSLRVPHPWKNLFRRLQAERTNRSSERTSVPSRNLSKVMRALVPDLVAIEPYAWQNGDRSWLYASEPVPPEALFLIARAWAYIAFAHLPEARLREELAALQVSDLQWNREAIDLARWSEAPNGTAKPENPNTFYLLPEVLAARLSREDVRLDVGDPPLRFRRAPIAPGDHGAELVSWPPRMLTDRRGGEWPFSVVVLLTVQTVPFQPFPVVHCDLSIRRWMNHPVRIPGKKDTSVYLLTNVPWIPGLRQSASFQVAPMRWGRVSDHDREADGRSFRVRWDSHLAPLVNRLRHPAPGFVDPEELCAKPEAALNPFGDVSAAIVFRNGMMPEHAVQPGLPPHDRRQLMDALSALLAPELTPVNEPVRVLRKGALSGSNPFFPSTNERSEPAKLNGVGVDGRRAIVRSVGPHVAFEIRGQSGIVSRELETAVRAVLGLSEHDTFPFNCPDSGLCVRLHAESLGATGDVLPLGTSGGSVRDRLHQAIRDRVARIAAEIEPASIPTATLIELSGADAYDEARGDGDPKHALRKGFAARGRVTQFINTQIDSKLPHRARSSVLDALRQLGVQPALPSAARLGLPEPLNCVGLWLIKNYRRSSSTQVRRMLPVMVRVDMATRRVFAIAAGFESWLPYPKALQAIAQEEVLGIERERDAQPFILSLLRQDLLSLGNTLLLCHAQNIRKAWPWLGNGKLTVEHLGLGDDTPGPIKERPGLRIVRIRSADENETPEWYAANGSAVGFPGGLFQVSERVFFSTHGKPKQFSGLSSRVSKLTSWTNIVGKSRPPSPDVHTWNASLLELTVPCLQPEDKGKAAEWAYLTHLLRDAAGHYDEETVLPLPLHLASKIDEYVLPLPQDEAAN